MGLFRSSDYLVGTSGGSLFGFSALYGNVGVGPRTTHLTSQKVYCWIDGDYFVLSICREYLSMINYYKGSYYLHKG